MAWTDWFKKREREVGMDYHISAEGFKCLSDDGCITSVDWCELIRVKIICTAKDHPQDEDLYWAFSDTEREYIVPNCKDIYGILPQLGEKLPGFRSDVMMEALASHGEKEYLCWKRNRSMRSKRIEV